MAETPSARCAPAAHKARPARARPNVPIGKPPATIYGRTMARRSSSAFGDLIALLFAPLAWLLRHFVGQKHAPPELVKSFYKTKEWAELRYAHLARNPNCKLCGRSAHDGARMNVDHIRPLSRFWQLRLAPHNLQTLCASCNRGKGGKVGDHRRRAK